MKTWLAVGAVILPILMVLSIEENPEKSIARGSFLKTGALKMPRQRTTSKGSFVLPWQTG